MSFKTHTIGSQVLAVYIFFVVEAQYTKTTTEQHFLWSHLSGCNNGVCHITIDESDPGMEFWTQQTSAYYYGQRSHVMCKLKTFWQSKGDHPILTHSLCKNGCSIQSMTPSRSDSIKMTQYLMLKIISVMFSACPSGIWTHRESKHTKSYNTNHIWREKQNTQNMKMFVASFSIFSYSWQCYRCSLNKAAKWTTF